MAKIAVENSLGNVRQALENSGFQVVNLDETSAQQCDCCVISGQDKNVLGITERATQAAVVNAQGMTAEQVVQQINQSIGR